MSIESNYIYILALPLYYEMKVPYTHLHHGFGGIVYHLYSLAVKFKDIHEFSSEIMGFL